MINDTDSRNTERGHMCTEDKCIASNYHMIVYCLYYCCTTVHGSRILRSTDYCKYSIIQYRHYLYPHAVPTIKAILQVSYHINATTTVVLSVEILQCPACIKQHYNTTVPVLYYCCFCVVYHILDREWIDCCCFEDYNTTFVLVGKVRHE